MRILWITADRFDTKADKSSWIEIAKGFQARGWQVDILAGQSKNGENQYSDLVRVIQAIDIPLIFRMSLMFYAYRWIKANARQYDVLIINPECLWLVPLVRRVSDIHIHLDIRTLPVNLTNLKRRLDRILFWKLPLRKYGKSADSYTFITTGLKIAVEEEFSIGVEQYAIWHSGVNTELFRPLAPTLDATETPVNLFYHGSLSNRRGIPDVIAALAFAPLPKPVTFTLVGTGPDVEEMKLQAQRLGLTEIVKFKGLLPYEDIPEEISKADICLCPLPSRLEWNVSSPLKILEYMACEKPMVLTSIPPHTDLVGDQPFVIWIDEQTPKAIHSALASACEQLEALTAAAPIGRSIVRSSMEWSNHADQFAEHLVRATASRRINQ